MTSHCVSFEFFKVVCFGNDVAEAGLKINVMEDDFELLLNI